MDTIEHYLELHTAPADDRNEGWIWVREKGQIAGVRRIMKVQYTGPRPPTSKISNVYCEVLYATDIDIRRFNRDFKPELDNTKDLILISAWYRRHLGIPAKFSEEKITVKLTSPKLPFSALWYCFACFQHPQAVVFLATVLAFLGLGLGLIGVGLGLIGIKEWGLIGRSVGVVFLLLGMLPIAISIPPLIKRGG